MFNKTTRFSLFTSLLLVLSFNANAALTDHFVTQWQTTAGNTSITIPTTGAGYSYSIDWDGDNSVDQTGITGNATHDYGVAGVHTVRITGDFPRIFFDNTGDKDKIISIDQWGTNTWTSMRRAFTGASNLVNNADDEPIMATSSSFLQMFLNATSIGTGTGTWGWDTSNITNMQGMFNNTQFDEDISTWNVENVTSFIGMFTNTTLSTVNYDALLISWDAQSLSANETFDAGNAEYCSVAAQTARANIIANDGWTINDAGKCNNAPIITSPTTKNTPENQQFVMNITATDADGDDLSYTLGIGGIDSFSFEINSSTGALSFLSAPNFEAPGALDGTNTYIVEVIVTDNGTPQKSTSGIILVSVTNVIENQAPTITTDANIFSPENQVDVVLVTSTDPENHTVTYSITGGADMTKLTIHPTTGQLDLITAPDFESPTDSGTDNTYIVQITATDDGSPNLSTAKTITVNVTNVAENQAPTITTNASLLSPENQADVVTIISTDPENDTVMYNLTGGADMALFSINPNSGQLFFDTVPNYEMPHSDDGTNEYYIVVTVTEVGAEQLFSSLAITINVSDEFEINPPYDVSTVENQTTITQVTTNGPRFPEEQFSLSGTDSSLFSINQVGILSFIDSPDFETPLSAAGTNTYSIEVNASSIDYFDDGSLPPNIILINGPTVVHAFTVTVTDILEFQPSDLFRTTWKTDNLSSGSSNSTSITIPTDSFNNTYAYQVDWNGDGNFNGIDEDTIWTGDATHDYGAGNEETYTINIFGIFPKIYFNGSNKDIEKIMSIEQWGTNPWGNMFGAFYKAKNLVNNATDTPDLANSFVLDSMFFGAQSIGNGTGIWDWDTSNITHMNFVFTNATSFNQDISSWNIENVATGSFNFEGLFVGTSLSSSNYDAILIGWNNQDVNPSLTLGSGSSIQYCSQAATDARQSLIDNDGWTIIDGGRDPICVGGNDIDLATIITDNTDTVAAGDLLDYVVEITNTGPDDTVDATVMIAEFTQQPPLVISAYSWVCSATGSATCSASGSTAVNEMVDIPTGDSITYTVSATISVDSSFDEVVFVGNAGTQTQNDTNLNNNFAVDINTNSDIIFKQGFDPIPQRSVQKVNSNDKQVIVDFSKIDQPLITINPILIVKGLNDTKQTDLLIHLRKFQDQLQIRMSNKQDGVWQVGQWSDVYNQGLTTLEW